jgi:hypothetical protein
MKVKHGILGRCNKGNHASDISRLRAAHASAPAAARLSIVRLRIDRTLLDECFKKPQNHICRYLISDESEK